DAVRSAGTVNRGGGGVLEHADRGYVVLVDLRDRPFVRDSVDYDQWLIAGRDRVPSADLKGVIGLRAGAGGGDGDAGDGALQRLFDGDRGAILELPLVDRGHRPGHVAPLLCSVTHHHDPFQ